MSSSLAGGSSISSSFAGGSSISSSFAGGSSISSFAGGSSVNDFADVGLLLTGSSGSSIGATVVVVLAETGLEDDGDGASDSTGVSSGMMRIFSSSDALASGSYFLPGFPFRRAHHFARTNLNLLELRPRKMKIMRPIHALKSVKTG